MSMGWVIEPAVLGKKMVRVDQASIVNSQEGGHIKKIFANWWSVIPGHPSPSMASSGKPGLKVVSEAQKAKEAKEAKEAEEAKRAKEAKDAREAKEAEQAKKDKAANDAKAKGGKQTGRNGEDDDDDIELKPDRTKRP
jgi:hypothetical protein